MGEGVEQDGRRGGRTGGWREKKMMARGVRLLAGKAYPVRCGERASVTPAQNVDSLKGSFDPAGPGQVSMVAAELGALLSQHADVSTCSQSKENCEFISFTRGLL